jgi:hypothetical protein
LYCGSVIEGDVRSFRERAPSMTLLVSNAATSARGSEDPSMFHSHSLVRFTVKCEFMIL